jgi:diguanylate cyclase (GGDEF)-like protein
VDARSAPDLSSAAAAPAADALDLRAALQLLEHAGLSPPADAAPGSTAWWQALVDGLCELSSRDPLTGLANRRPFELTLARELGRVARAGEQALLLTLDIDHFKQVNDRHGHAVGDLVLKAVAAVLVDAVRPMDTVARIGGEEFAIVLPNCLPGVGPTVAERVRRRIAEHRVPLPDGSSLAVTVSLGGAFAPPWVRSSPAVWLERADRQLYRAKAEGRNRACFEPVAVTEVSAEEKGLLFSAPIPLQDAE